MLQDLKTVHSYFSSHGTRCVAEVGALAEGCCNCFKLNKSDPTRSFIKRIFSFQRPNQSLLPPAFALTICNFEETKQDGRSPFPDNMVYYGNKKAVRKNQTETTARDMGVLGVIQDVEGIDDDQLLSLRFLDRVKLEDSWKQVTDGGTVTHNQPSSPQLVLQRSFKISNTNLRGYVSGTIDNRNEAWNAWEEQQKNAGLQKTFQLDLAKHKAPPVVPPKQPKKKTPPKPSAKKNAATASPSEEPIDSVLANDDGENPSTQNVSRDEQIPSDMINVSKPADATKEKGDNLSSTRRAAREAMSAITRDVSSDTDGMDDGMELEARTSNRRRTGRSAGAAQSTPTTARATSRNTTTTPITEKVSEDIVQKALKLNKGGATDAVKKTAIELSPSSTYQPLETIEAVGDIWRHVRTAQHQLNLAMKPSPSATKVDQRKQLKNVATYINHAEHRCEALARNLGYKPSKAPGIHRGKGDAPLSELLSALQQPLASRDAIIIIGYNANLEPIEADTTFIASSFGWSDNKKRISPADLERCAIVFEIPSTRDLADTMSKIISDLQSFADKPPTKSRGRKRKNNEVKETEAATEYNRVLGRALFECNMKGWQVNTVADPDARHIALVWKSYYDHMNEQMVTPSKRTTR